MSFAKYFYWLLTVLTALCAEDAYAQVTRTLSVADGIPQSYISGIVQDKQGFVWIASRDGLAKYDGRKFRIFRHDAQEPRSLTDNIIVNLYLDDTGKLWITFEQGDVDVLDTFTEKIEHFSGYKGTALIREAAKTGRSMVHLGGGIYWAIGTDGNVYVVDYKAKKVSLKRHDVLLPGIRESSITGIALAGQEILLVTSRSFVYLDRRQRIRKTVPYTFSARELYNPRRRHKDNSPMIRKNGEVLINDEESLIIYSPSKNAFDTIALPWERLYLSPPRILDQGGNLFFGYGGSIYKLDTTNELSMVLSETGDQRTRQTALLLDQSGLLWAGTNGFGIRQADFYLKQMPQFAYKNSFQEDVLQMLGVPEKELRQTFLDDAITYAFRWANGKNEQIWLSKSGADVVIQPHVGLLDHGKLTFPDWTYSSQADDPNYGIDALAVSSGGALWGIDHVLRPVLFDTEKRTATVKPSIARGDHAGKQSEINGFTIDGEDVFWISTSQGLINYNISNGLTRYFFQNGNLGRIMALRQDPGDPDILWLGSSSQGLIRFNKKTGAVRSFTIKDGLPNSTVYAILSDANGKLWCSTNKGIFSFDPLTERSRAYVTQGQLAVDEFNRFHDFQFPDGRLAFGSTEGFTVFDPLELLEDTFEPRVALTGIKINNKASDYGQPGTMLQRSVNSISELVLPYDKNFLAFEFAALQFNLPQKLQYRYRLHGLDDEWVVTGTDNTATYTTIPPGEYELEINASNTAGKWSSYVKSLHIVIQPPFWATWWFRVLGFMLLVAAIYLLVRFRTESIRKKTLEKIDIERKAMELEGQALRAQMNPHFIFNCLNSIKALIQEDEKRKAVIYLTTFSKLIRAQLYNTEREITLHQELQTCRFYLELEALRFTDRIAYEFSIDPTVGPEQIMVPPLILQPFVENAIIHGILPLDRTGHILITVQWKDGQVMCSIDDDGIGREKSRLERDRRDPVHVSKGTLLAEDRIKIHNSLNDKQFLIYITDKRNRDGSSAGTRITLIINSTL